MFTKYTEILIVDREGVILYSGGTSRDPLDPPAEELIGKNVVDLFENLNEENSTLIKAAQRGIATENYEQKLRTNTGDTVIQISSTYPIINGSAIVGAIEYCEFKKRISVNNTVHTAWDRPIYRKNNTRYIIEDFITSDSAMLAVKETVKQIAKTDSSILIEGETGTGKEIIAQSIHNLSVRSTCPFVSLNCGAIPSTLIESILFGTVKGGFTDAENKVGILESAQNGTVFLDEINSLPIELQVKLLKVIEDQRIRRIGDTKEVDLNVRFISATNEATDYLLEGGKFRHDLYYRLSVVQLHLSKLADRISDIELLVNHYIDYYNKKLDRKIPHASGKILDLLKTYSWPGNVRELRNTIEGLFNLSQDDDLDIEKLPERIKFNKAGIDANSPDENNLKSLVKDYEFKIIQEVYKENGFNMSRAANQLGISRQLLKYKLDRFEDN